MFKGTSEVADRLELDNKALRSVLDTWQESGAVANLTTAYRGALIAEGVPERRADEIAGQFRDRINRVVELVQQAHVEVGRAHNAITETGRRAVENARRAREDAAGRGFVVN